MSVALNPHLPRTGTAEETPSAMLRTALVAEWVVSRTGMLPGELTGFLDPRLKDLTDPDGMLDRDVAARRLAKAISAGERVVVFGDYDCDGITSTAILTECLRELARVLKTEVRVIPQLANRFDGGYGVSEAATARIIAAKPHLLVTCDCGSSDHPSLRRIRAAGIETVVIDHHLVPDEPLPVLAFLNPHRPECGFRYKGLASCGLVLSLAAALRKELGVPLDVRRWLDLVAIGTIADVAPLDGDNRALVRAGLAALRRAERPGLRALLNLAKVSLEAPITARDVGFRVAPQINAPGRMGAPDLALQLLLAPDAAVAEALALQLQVISDQRRQQQEQMVEEACSLIEAQGDPSQPAIVVGQVGWNHGIVGIVAGRLCDRFAKPVIVIGFEKSGSSGRGSVRGPNGSRLYDALAECAPVLVRFGGHQAAAGLEVTAENLAALRARFSAAVAAQQSSAQTTAALPSAAARDPGPLRVNSEEPEHLLADLDLLEPCGQANPRPRLLFAGEVLDAREVKGGHLKLELRLPGGQRVSGFAPGMGNRVPELVGAGPGRAGTSAQVTGDLRHNVFRGVDKAEMFIEKIEIFAPARE